MFRTVRRLPFFKLLAIAQVALLAHRHLQRLTPAERQRLTELARHPTSLTAADRSELGSLVAKLEPRAFATSAADHLSPFPLPRKLAGRFR